MKARSKILLPIVIGISAIGIYLSGCKKNEDSAPSASTEKSDLSKNNKNSLIYPVVANMFGKSYAEWGNEWWKWSLSFDCAHLPFIDHTGALQDQNQSGPVFFLCGTAGTTETRSVTVPSDKAILFPLVNYYANYPCGSGQPAQGESMEHCLTAQVEGVVPYMDQLSLTIDGTVIENLTDYYALSSLFNLTGNADLANCYDNCLTGNPQPAVSGGYWIMLKPLAAGHHLVHFTGGATALNFRVDVTYHLTVQ